MIAARELRDVLDGALARRRRLVVLRTALVASSVGGLSTVLALAALGTGRIDADARLVLVTGVLVATLVAARIAALGGSALGSASATLLRDRDRTLYEDIAGAEALARSGAGAGCSEALAEAHVAVALERLRPMGRRGLAPGSLLRPGLVTGALALVGIVAVVIWARPALGNGAELALASTALERLAVAEEPLVGDVDLQLHFPAHLDRPVREIPSSTGDVEAPKGTRVRIRTRALAPIAQASLRTEGGTRLALRRKGQRLEGELLVSRDDRYAFVLQSTDGRIQREARWRSIRSLPDAVPRAEILDPAVDLTLAPDETLRGRFRARDDVALSEVALVLHVEGRDEERRVLVRPTERTADLSGEFVVQLPELGLHGGETVGLAIESVDNDSVSGPKRGLSEARTLVIASPASQHRALVEEQARLLDVLVTILADRLERPVPGPRPARRVHERFERIRAGTEEAIRLLSVLQEGLSSDALSRRDVGIALGGIRERLSGLLQQEMRLHREVPAEETERREVDRRTVSELESDVLLVADLLGRQRLDSLEQLGEDVNQTRERLAELLSRYERSRGEAVRRELLEEIARLEAQVASLYERLAEIESRVPGEFLNAEALRQIDLLSELQALRESLASGNVRGAAEALRSLEKRMQDLMAALEASSARFTGERFADAERARSELLSAVGEMETEQRSLARRTEAVQDRFRRRLAEEMAGRIDPLVQRLVGRVDAALRALDEVEASEAPEVVREELARVRERILDLRALLEQGDLDEARAMAEEASAGLSSAESTVRFFADDASGAHAGRAIARARPPIDEVAETLRRSLPDLPSLLGEADGRSLRGQSSPQRRLADRARDLEEGLREPDAPMPFLSEDASRLLGEAEARMRASAEHLRDADARGALREQDAALSELRRLREAAENPSRPVGLDPSVGRRVRIPRPEEHRGADDLRRRILEALREEAPAAYADEVRRYLEELAR